MVLCLILGPLVTIRDLKVFASCHIVADLIIIVGAVYIEVYSVMQFAKHGVDPSVSAFTSIMSAMRMVGIATGAFEVSAMVIPIYKESGNKAAYPFIQSCALVVVSVLYSTFGAFGYLAFGKDVRGPVTISLDQRRRDVEVIELIYILALFPTILMQIYPPIQILEHYAALTFRENKPAKQTAQVALRVVLVVAAVWIGVLFGEKFDLVLSLLGNLVCAPVSYLFPGLIHLALVAEDRGEKARDIALIVFGLLCLVVATVFTVISFAA